MDGIIINKVISENLRNIRTKMNYSLDKASELTGISKSMLGQIERGESTPTVTTLWKISNGLKISFSSLMEYVSNDTEIITQDKVPKLDDVDDGCTIYPFIPYSPEIKFESYIMDLAPGSSHSSEAHVNASYEYVYVITGKIKIDVGGTIHDVEENQMLKFNANSSHTYLNQSDKVIKCHIIIAVK
ncbi:MAG: XRE family transcriptional regulator [Clostridiaceae bacterium]|jgi:transcriptional regulator with XRE-family HTH domain|nr:XRE family transcriptional regulator [Clostridiaceae bacterium]